MFNKHQKHPCMQKISIFYRKTKKLRKGAPGEEYQTGPFFNLWREMVEVFLRGRQELQMKKIC